MPRASCLLVISTFPGDRSDRATVPFVCTGSFRFRHPLKIVLLLPQPLVNPLQASNTPSSGLSKDITLSVLEFSFPAPRRSVSFSDVSTCCWSLLPHYVAHSRLQDRGSSELFKVSPEYFKCFYVAHSSIATLLDIVGP